MLEVREERNIKDDTNNNPIITQLIEFGINPTYSKRLFHFYHPTTIDDILDYLAYENGKIQHNFVQDRNNFENDLCYLCGEARNIHNNNNLSNNIHRSFNEHSLSSSFPIKSGIYNSFKNSSLKSESKNSENSISFQPEIECPICSESFLPNKNNTLKACGHRFCNGCWYDFLSIKIQENKLTSIKCLDYKCQEIPDDNFIINLLNSNNNLIEKYKRFKLNLEIINDPNKKMCPFPNCNSYLELKDEDYKIVKCLNNHIYCFFCLNKPHGKEPCNFQLKDSLVEYAKNNLIKKCPKCNIVIQKNNGCNHITCINCNYQWCWLCNEKYTFDHFEKGKCKGYQNFQPKDQHDIELAFEGKIKLRGSQIQDELDFSENDENENNNNFNNFREFSFENNPNNSDRSENSRNFYRENNISNNIDKNKKCIKCESDSHCCKILEKTIMFIFYLFCGHIYISEKLYFQAWKNYFVSASILLFEFPFFFLQVYINILMIFPYFIKEGFDFFIVFIEENEFKEIILFAYYSLLILFLGSFLEAVYFMCYFFRYSSKKVIILSIIFGIFLSFIILPLHIIINPILLMYIFIKNHCDYYDILSEMKMIANYAKENLLNSS